MTYAYVYNLSSCSDNKHTEHVSTQSDGLQHRELSTSGGGCVSSAEAPRQPGHGSCACQLTAWCRKDMATSQHSGICAFPWDSHQALWQGWNRATFLHHFTLHAYLAFRTTLGEVYSTQNNNPVTMAGHLLCWQMSFIQEIAATCFQVIPSTPHPCSG